MPPIPDTTLLFPNLNRPVGVPYWTTEDGYSCRLYLGDVLGILRSLTRKSIHCVVTSPPYWGLRSYLPKDHPLKPYEIGSEPLPDCKSWGQAQCGKCFVCTMVKVFRGVREVLRDDGCLWLNLGDKMGKAGLIGLPWRVAMALQEDGWRLASCLPWIKRDVMPESARNRPNMALEQVLLFTKQTTGYYFDMDAIRPPLRPATPARGRYPRNHPNGWHTDAVPISGGDKHDGITRQDTVNGRHFRNSDLWFASLKEPHGVVGIDEELVGLDVTKESYRIRHSTKHFAMFPKRLVTPLILAGTSAEGCCVECGNPHLRVTERTKLTRPRPNDHVKRIGQEGTGNSISNSVAGVESVTLGWQPTCECDMGVIPCTVLDPFVGSGVTCVVALQYGRRTIGIDLFEDYLRDHAVQRITNEALIPNEKASRSGRTIR